MLINYTAENLLSELQAQGVIVKPTPDGNLFLDGEMSEAQFSAVKKLKPQIINAVNKNQTFRFGENEFLFRDLEKCLQIFSIESDAANRVIQYLHAVGAKFISSGELGVCFNFPTTKAYITELNLADGIQMNEAGELSDKSLKSLTDRFIKSHLLTNQTTDWLQEKDVPLFQAKLLCNGEQKDFAIGNTIQTAIITAYWSVVNSECSYEIEKA